MSELQGRCECGRTQIVDDGAHVPLWVFRHEGYELRIGTEGFCPFPGCGSRCNAGCTADAGSAAWRDHEAMQLLRARAGQEPRLFGGGFDVADAWRYWDGEVPQGIFEPDPADAILAAKAALEVPV